MGKRLFVQRRNIGLTDGLCGRTARFDAARDQYVHARLETPQIIALGAEEKQFRVTRIVADENDGILAHAGGIAIRHIHQFRPEDLPRPIDGQFPDRLEMGKINVAVRAGVIVQQIRDSPNFQTLKRRGALLADSFKARHRLCPPGIHGHSPPLCRTFSLYRIHHKIDETFLKKACFSHTYVIVYLC